MSRIKSFLQLVRWPNLVFIVLTQLLLYFCIYLPIFNDPQPARLSWLIAASVCIAAAGYIINDYFDLNIDQINKPQKNMLLGKLSRRWAIVWHLALSFMGVLATALAVGLSKWYLILGNCGCVFLLWVYSTSLKRRAIVGNLAISVLTAWTVLILFFAFTSPDQAFAAHPLTIRFFRLCFMYAGFAFVSSMVREAVKDMEDLEGDIRYHCRTLPIVAGIRATKIYSSVWATVLLGALMVLVLYILQFGWWLAALFSAIFVLIPLVLLLLRLRTASSKADFARLSSLCKQIMLSGILTMFFYWLKY